MKAILIFMALLCASMQSFVLGQGMMSSPTTIKLEQTAGEFGVKGLTLTEGEYVFEVSNNGVDHMVAFAMTPAGKEDMDHVIQESFLQRGGERVGLNNGETAQTLPITLKKGKYSYWCPANPTPIYTLTVKKSK